MSDGLPPAGWYPDPLERHAERFWDGAEWSERVRDGSLESADPLHTPDPAHEQSAAEVEQTSAYVDPLDELLAATSGGAADAFVGEDPLEEFTAASVVTGSGPDAQEVAEEVFGTTFDREPLAGDPAGLAAAPSVDPFAPAAAVGADESSSAPAMSAEPATSATAAAAEDRVVSQRGVPEVIGAVLGFLGVLLLLVAGAMLLSASAGVATADTFTAPAGLASLGLGFGAAAALLRR